MELVSLEDVLAVIRYSQNPEENIKALPRVVVPDEEEE